MSDQKDELPEVVELPVIAVRNTVLYPNLSTPINVGRPKSIKAIREAKREGLLCVVAQKAFVIPLSFFYPTDSYHKNHNVNR